MSPLKDYLDLEKQNKKIKLNLANKIELLTLNAGQAAKYSNNRLRLSKKKDKQHDFTK